MSKTRAELIERALFNMGVLAVGQIVSPEDVLKMDGYVDPTVALLSGLSIYYVQDAGSAGPTGGDIEDEAFLPLADYLAMKAAVAFNLGDDAKLTALGLKAESDLRTISAAPRTLKTLRVDAAISNRRWGMSLNQFLSGT
jgi:hypothetical protein